ncbi:MAG: glycosyltransferase family 2 protein [Candidatus Dormibacteraceae bacterium]
MAEPIELSVVVPAFDESRRLPETMAVLRPYLVSLGVTWELILVNDGSHDNTWSVIEGEARGDERVRGVNLRPNRGKGGAVAAGVATSRGRLVLISDADLSTPIDEWVKLRDAIEAGSDVAIGSRAKRGAKVVVSQPAHRVLMGKIFNLIVQGAVLPGVWDTQCGFKLWRGDLARAVFADMKLQGNVAFDVEVLYRARRAGRRIAEVPVRWYDSVPSRISPFKSSIEAFFDIVKIRFMV